MKVLTVKAHTSRSHREACFIMEANTPQLSLLHQMLALCPPESSGLGFMSAGYMLNFGKWIHPDRNGLEKLAIGKDETFRVVEMTEEEFGVITSIPHVFEDGTISVTDSTVSFSVGSAREDDSFWTDELYLADLKAIRTAIGG